MSRRSSQSLPRSGRRPRLTCAYGRPSPLPPRADSGPRAGRPRTHALRRERVPTRHVQRRCGAGLLLSWPGLTAVAQSAPASRCSWAPRCGIAAGGGGGAPRTRCAWRRSACRAAGRARTRTGWRGRSRRTWARCVRSLCRGAVLTRGAATGPAARPRGRVCAPAAQLRAEAGPATTSRGRTAANRAAPALRGLGLTVRHRRFHSVDRECAHRVAPTHTNMQYTAVAIWPHMQTAPQPAPQGTEGAPPPRPAPAPSPS
jgi:hypothetical protein